MELEGPSAPALALAPAPATAPKAPMALAIIYEARASATCCRSLASS